MNKQQKLFIAKCICILSYNLAKIIMGDFMKRKNKIVEDISSVSIGGQPQTPFDMVNKYGTYEIQPTADTNNDFPAIAQGMPKGKHVVPRVRKEREEEKY